MAAPFEEQRSLNTNTTWLSLWRTLRASQAHRKPYLGKAGDIVTLNPSTGASISPSFLIALWRFPFRTEPVKRWGMNYGMVGRILAAVFLTLGCLQNGYAAKTWQVGTPIVT